MTSTKLQLETARASGLCGSTSATFATASLSAIFVSLLAGTFASACADRTYLTKSHGRAYAEAFDRQAVTPKPRPTGKGMGTEPTEGLDSQEASVVARSYRQSLSGKEGGTDGAGPTMVITNGGAGQPAPYMPPPSVPNGQ